MIVGSRIDQRKDGKLDRQAAWAKQQLDTLGVEVVATWRAVETAKSFDPTYRSLAPSAAYAPEHNAVLVAVTVDRFVRHKDYHPATNRDVQPTVYQFEKLQELVGGVTMATILPPGQPWRESHSSKIKAGQEVSGRKGGRPPRPGYKKRRRAKYQKKVEDMRIAGYSPTVIMRVLKLPKTTVYRWAKDSTMF